MNLFSIQNLRGLKTSFLNEKSYQKVAKALVLNGRKLTVKMNCLTWIKFYDRCFLQYFFALRHFLSLEKKKVFLLKWSRNLQTSKVAWLLEKCKHVGIIDEKHQGLLSENPAKYYFLGMLSTHCIINANNDSPKVQSK